MSNQPDVSTLKLVEQLIRLGKGMITALEEWLRDHRAANARDRDDRASVDRRT